MTTKTITSPHVGIRFGVPGAASVVTADRGCIGADARGRCVEAATCGRHAKMLVGGCERPMVLPRVAGCECRYRTPIAGGAA